jgi:hypothetical protein
MGHEFYSPPFPCLKIKSVLYMVIFWSACSGEELPACIGMAPEKPVFIIPKTLACRMKVFKAFDVNVENDVK